MPSVANTLDDRVAVGFAPFENGEDERRGRRGDKFLAELHARTIHSGTMYVN